MRNTKQDLFIHLARNWEELGLCLWHERDTYPQLDGFDLDVLCEPRPWTWMVDRIDACAREVGWSVIMHVRQGQRMTCLLATDGHVPGVDDGYLQVDVHRSLGIAAMPLVSARETLARSEVDHGIRWMSRTDSAIVDFLSETIAADSVKSRYVHRWLASLEKDRSKLRKRATEAVGRRCAAALMTAHEVDRKSLLRAQRFSAVWRRPGETSKSLLAKLWHVTMSYLSPVGRFWAFSGPDGSGKTTLIETMSGMTSRRIVVSTSHFHTRPFLLPRLNAFVPMSREARDRLNTMRHTPTRSHLVTSLIRLAYILIDYNLGYWMKVRPKLARGNLVAFDRYYQDFLVDPALRGIRLPRRLLEACAVLMPRPDRHVIVLASGETLARRKGELTPSEGERQSESYRRLAQHVRSPILVNSEESSPDNLARSLARTLAADLQRGPGSSTHTRKLRP